MAHLYYSKHGPRHVVSPPSHNLRANMVRGHPAFVFEYSGLGVGGLGFIHLWVTLAQLEGSLALGLKV